MAVYYVRNTIVNTTNRFIDRSKNFFSTNYPYKAAIFSAILSRSFLNTSYVDSTLVGGLAGFAAYEAGHQSYLSTTAIVSAIASKVLFDASVLVGGTIGVAVYGGVKLYQFFTNEKKYQHNQDKIITNAKKEIENKKSNTNLHVQRMKVFLYKNEAYITALTTKAANGVPKEEKEMFHETCKFLNIDIALTVPHIWQTFSGIDAAAYQARLELLKNFLPDETRKLFD